MALITENIDRRVIPNWRSFRDTLNLGELGQISKEVLKQTAFDINTYIEDWNKNKTLIFAAELLSAATVRDLNSLEEVKAASKFIIEKGEDIPPSLLTTANSILGLTNSSTNRSRINSIDEFLSDSTRHLIYLEIHKNKKRLKEYPRNSILLVETARLYTIIGEKVKAKKLLHQALSLAPNNRYISRSSARFFSEIEEDDHYAIKILRKNEFLKSDPWLLSAEIALNSKLKKSSKLINVGKSLVENETFDYFETSELSSAIGTEELLNGSRKKSKQFFNLALIKPNDNSLAQVEWATNQDKSIIINDDLFISTRASHEAKTLNAYFNKDWDSVAEFSLNWFFDMPNHIDSLLVGSRVISVFQENYITAAKFMEAGLVSHPTEDLLLNNAAYYLAMANRPIEALNYLNRVKKFNEPSNATELCVLATQGLIQYRLGNYSLGREYYLKVIEIAEKHYSKHYLPLAALNYIREEIRSGSRIPDIIVNKIREIPNEKLDFETLHLKNEILTKINSDYEIKE